MAALGACTPRGSIRAPSSRARRLLDRAAWAARPGDVEHLADVGEAAWIEEQLHPDRIDDFDCDLRTAFIDAWNAPADLAFEIRPEHVEQQLAAYTLTRAVYSERQLYEVMVAFWSDHFHVSISKGECKHLALLHVRDAIRPNVFAPFRDLLRAATLSPAMLVYLDGRDNTARAPNENHARELLELHTLGVDGGYTQKDVMEAARCLTGWRVRRRWAPGQLAFVEAEHSRGTKNVLGRAILHAERDEVDSLLDVIVAQPSCARFVARKLARFFVADAPSDALVDEAASAFGTRGDTRAALRVLLRSDALYVETKVKRPFRYVVSALRALEADCSFGRRGTLAHLRTMGQTPFGYPTPDGYPHESRAWLGTLNARWRYAWDLTHDQVPDSSLMVDSWIERAGGGDAAWEVLIGRAPREAERNLRGADSLALALSTPEFQLS